MKDLPLAVEKAPKTRFYAFVVPNRLCGLCYSWEECKQHVQNAPKARYRAFDSRDDAFTFLYDGAPYQQYPHGPVSIDRADH